MKDEVDEIKSKVIENASKITEKWGFNPLLGKIYGVLLFSGDAMSLQEIADSVDYSVSSVSQNIPLLLNFGAIKRIKKPGDKKAYFQAEYDLMVATRKMIESFHEIEVKSAIPLLEESIDKLEAIYEKDNKEEIEETLKRLRKLLLDYKRAKKYLDLLMKVPLEKLP